MLYRLFKHGHEVVTKVIEYIITKMNIVRSILEGIIYVL